MKKIELEQFLDAKFLGNVKMSPSQERFAFLASMADMDKNEYHHTLYLGEQGKTKKMRTFGKNSGYLFLDEERLLVDLQKVKKEEKALKEEAKKSFYYLDLQSNTLSVAFTLPFRANLETRISNDVVLLSSMMTTDEHVLLEGTDEQRKAFLKTEKKDALYEDVDELPYYFNGQGFTANKVKQLFLYHIKEARITRIFDHDFDLGTYTLSNDLKKIYYTGKHREKVKTFTSKIYQYDVLSGQHEVIYDYLDYNIVMLKEVSQELVVAAKDMTSFGMSENADFYYLKDGKLTLLSKFGEAIGNSVGTDMRLLGSEQSIVHKDALYFVATLDDHTEVYRLTLEGDLSPLYRMLGAIDALFVVDGELCVIGMKDQKLQEVYKLDLEKQKLLMVTRLNTNLLSKYYVAKPKRVLVRHETHDVLGYVLLPKDYDKEKQYPAILDIHGGPKTVYGTIYYHEMQYWANMGYFVFFANPRGSDGLGDTFADIRGKYGTIDYEDLMDFTDKVLKKYPAIDQTNLFVTGGSYGGFMTNWIVGHTDIFKAAVTQRSISNWISFYGTSDIGYFFASDQTDGHPLLDMDKLYEQSPIKYAMNINTPLRFIHSDKDLRCPIEQAQQLYAVLKTNNVDTDLIWFKEETHELSRSGKPQARIKRLKDITEWFEKYRS